MEHLQYPIGKYQPQLFSEKQKKDWLLDIKFLPQELELAIINLDEVQLQTPYRPGGWTVHQLIHHVADSHMNALIRFKLALTEDFPTIKPYQENDWAQLADVQQLPINISLTLLHALHARWYALVSDLTLEQWQQKGIIHPQWQQKQTLWFMLGNYAWHGKHHTAHVTALKESMGW
jgi:hypothetical protein